MKISRDMIIAGLATVGGLAIISKTPVMKKDAETLVFNARGFPKKLRIQSDYPIKKDAITDLFNVKTGYFYRIDTTDINENYKFVVIRGDGHNFYTLYMSNYESLIKNMVNIYHADFMPSIFWTHLIMNKRKITPQEFYDDSKNNYANLNMNVEKERFAYVVSYFKDLFKNTPVLSRQTYDEFSSVKQLPTDAQEHLWELYTTGKSLPIGFMDRSYERNQIGNSMKQIYNYLFGIIPMSTYGNNYLKFTDEQKEESLKNLKAEDEIYRKQIKLVSELVNDFDYKDLNAGEPKQKGINNLLYKNCYSILEFPRNLNKVYEFYKTKQRNDFNNVKNAITSYPLTNQNFIDLYQWYLLKNMYLFYNGINQLYDILDEKNYDYQQGAFLENIRWDWYAYKTRYDVPSRYQRIIRNTPSKQDLERRSFSESLIKKMIIKNRPLFIKRIAEEKEKWKQVLSAGRDEKAEENAKYIKDEIAKNDSFGGLGLQNFNVFHKIMKELKKKIESAGNLITDSEKQQVISALKNAQERDIDAQINKAKTRYDNEVGVAKQRYDDEEARFKRRQNQNELLLKRMMEELDED